MTFTLYAPPAASALAPLLAPAAGGTLLRVTGAALGGGCDRTCSFDGAPQPAAAEPVLVAAYGEDGWVDGEGGDGVLCAAPPAPPTRCGCRSTASSLPPGT